MVSAALLCATLLPALAVATIDRQEVVSRYNVVRRELITNKTTPLQVGNGNFAFNVDNTGMQTVLPFNTLSSWAWHNDSLPTNGEKLSDYQGVPYLTHGRNVSYDDPDKSLPEVTQWLIGNPNRINLGRIGLMYKGEAILASQISEPHQELDVWNGIITSTFLVGGQDVKVVTQGDFESDAVAFQIESELITAGDLKVHFDFPFPPRHTVDRKFEIFVGSYEFPQNHTTTMSRGCQTGDRAHIFHQLQETSYYLNLRWPIDSLLRLKPDAFHGTGDIRAHRYMLSPTSKVSSMAFTAQYSPDKRKPDLPRDIQLRNPTAWNDYWKDGGFVDLSSSSNPKANELQRRIILSQYHVRVNSAATGQSPQESGLMNNGWYGKFHMEMLVWHHGHWAAWGRQRYFDRIFPALYETMLPSSIERAKTMGWDGARWPKMTELDTKRSSPGGINAFLNWQQPHTMYLAELAYQASPALETLRKWENVLTAAADYMASYAWYNTTTGRYDLGPPAIGVTENTPPKESLNLGYEVAYWRYGLDVACEWKKRLGQPIPEKWKHVAENMAAPPIADDGLYTVYEGLNSSWWDDAKLIKDPRSVIMLRGIMPDTPAVDPDVARRTADRVMEVWHDQKITGWGRPVFAINSVKVGNPERAVMLLTQYEYWEFDDAGFASRSDGGATPPPFIPGNAAFLYAISFMTGGWRGCEDTAPGFPKDGTWNILHEDMVPAL